MQLEHRILSCDVKLNFCFAAIVQLPIIHDFCPFLFIWGQVLSRFPCCSHSWLRRKCSQHSMSSLVFLELLLSPVLFSPVGSVHVSEKFHLLVYILYRQISDSGLVWLYRLWFCLFMLFPWLFLGISHQLLVSCFSSYFTSVGMWVTM